MTTAPTTDRARDIARHLASGPRLVGDVASFPSHAEFARTLIEPGSIATLATLTATGDPYCSLLPISTRPGGTPIMCISAIAEHTRNLERDPRASILARAIVEAPRDPMAAARVTLIGNAVRFIADDSDVEHHLAVHPHAADYIGMSDFSWWRFETTAVRHIGGFGFMGWSAGGEFASAAADPIIPHADSMIEHLNADHADSCLAIVRQLAGADTATSATVTAVDRYGITFDVWERHDFPAQHGVWEHSDVREQSGLQEHGSAGDLGGEQPTITARVAFGEPLHSPDQVRGASVDLVRRAQAAATASPPSPTTITTTSPTTARKHP